ncbi:uncharacterized protein LOC135331560 isoform X2 [Halichondria panicea]|uniref:uncharacterized protein LOC135331560 isoform X2 n=1 Tax=Halichondria panicea TaxID=6063 RepID=UPI00312B5C55
MELDRLMAERLLSNEAGPQAHDKVLAALRDTAAAIVESTPTQAQHTLVSLQTLFTTHPLSPTTLTTTLATIETALTICSSVNASTELSDHLACLFKTTYSLLKSAVGLMDTMMTSDPQLPATLTALLGVAAASMTFDPSMVAVCWKGLGRGLPKVKGHAVAILIVKELCIVLEKIYCKCPGEKEVKLATFLGNLLCRTIQECDDGGWWEGDVIKCCVAILSKGECVVEEAFALADALLSILTHRRSCLELLMTPTITNQHCLGRLLCLCVLVHHLPKLQEELIEYCLGPLVETRATCPLVESLLICLSQNYVWLQVPVRVPGPKMDGMITLKSVSLSECVACSLSLLTLITPPQYLGHVEWSLFRGVLSPLLHVSLLAIDALFYHARRCSQSVQAHYIQLSQELLKQMTSQSLSVLLHRLMRLPSISLLPPPSHINSSNVARYLRILISSPSWLVHTLALEAFTAIAKVSADTTYVESCVPPGYTDATLHFLQQRASGYWSEETVKMGLTQQGRSYLAQSLYLIINSVTMRLVL